ncbi:hypothetical protein QWI17_21935 [Gilvimarinus sp. SDUM040013]|uniref:Uncharacterized protein n=1 Tax=Gilvimarinus gilvus TaxID=3058038 RepID=A0ABU4RUR8_9GAMM|nr:hypothetical protein [Gilvimarinus sp. SDUM040013]MDO3388523.1 hypothetical protein [Gilvimarinus sp. SDUM040013]MDX6848605.1 hypothetical protein [Gilvimarinus sp. SDUM040013]
MYKHLTFSALTLASLSAAADDTFYIRDFDSVISQARVMNPYSP